MPAPDMRALSAQVTEAVKGYTARAVEPINHRLAQVSADLSTKASIDFVRAEIAAAVIAHLTEQPDVQPPLSADDLRALVAPLVAELAPAGKQGDPGKDGRDADPAQVQALVDATVARVVAGLPAPPPGRDGREVDPQAVRDMVDGAVARAVTALPAPQPGRDGASVDAEAVRNMVETSVSRAVAALPQPKDGRDADPESVRSMVAAEVARAAPMPQSTEDDFAAFGEALARRFMAATVA